MPYNRGVMRLPFGGLFKFPRSPLSFFNNRPNDTVSIDIGTYSAKIVELTYREEKAFLKTYGELPSSSYLKGGGTGVGFLRYLDTDLVTLIKNALAEAGVGSRNAAISIPTATSFITTISLPLLSRKEIEQAVPYEARKYIPIPVSEVVLDWEILPSEAEEKKTDVLLVAVPKEIIEKFKRVGELSGLTLRTLEVETFSELRSLIDRDPAPTAIINLGHQSTTLACADQGKLRASNHFTHGSFDLTRALESGLGITRDRAEATKRELGLSERVEEREIVSVITPILDILFTEIERTLSLYNRRARRKVQKIILTGGGSNLKGIVDYVSTKFGLEVSKGNPFSRIVTPPPLQPVLRELGPSFSTAVGLALHEMVTQ